jgi:cation transport ATPase
MMRVFGFVLFLLSAASCAAQFRVVEISFKGVGCASCIESLPSRVQRLRGVESAAVDAQAGVLTVKLAEQNRVRLEQIRDFVEQDGAKAVRAVVEVKGEVRDEGDRKLLQVGSATYELEGSVSPGAQLIKGDIEDLKPTTGTLRIRIVAHASMRAVSAFEPTSNVAKNGDAARKNAYATLFTAR